MPSVKNLITPIASAMDFCVPPFVVPNKCSTFALRLVAPSVMLRGLSPHEGNSFQRLHFYLESGKYLINK